MLGGGADQVNAGSGYTYEPGKSVPLGEHRANTLLARY